MAIARTFTPFLKRYQTDEPVMPFLGRDLAELLKVKIHTGRNARYHYNAISSFRRVSECLHSHFPCSELSVLDFARTSIHFLVCLLTESSETLMKRELLQDATTVQLTRLDITERKNWVHLQDVDIGLGAESILKVV